MVGLHLLTARVFIKGSVALTLFVVATQLAHKTLNILPWREDASNLDASVDFDGDLKTLRDIGSAHKTSTRNQLKSNEKDKAQRKQKIVLLPGPHKTGTTSVQKCMAEWTSQNILADWVWPVVEGTAPYGPGKAYLSLYFQLRGGSEAEYPGLKYAYRDRFLHAWLDKKNIVFGTETMDYTLVKGGEKVIDEVLDMMPWETGTDEFPINGSRDDILVSVTYRAPRAKQLVSLWHEIGYPGQSLAEFIVALTHDADQWHTLNPLGLADNFVRKGLSVVIIDTSGVTRDGLDISHVVACGVLNATCVNNKLVGAPKRETVVNKKNGRGKADLTDEQLERVEDILRRFDNSFCHLSTDSSVHTLHAETIFSSCDSNGQDDGISFYEAIHHIKQIAIEVTGSEYAEENVNCGEHYAISCSMCPLRIWQADGGFTSPCEADCRICETGYYGNVCLPEGATCRVITPQFARVHGDELPRTYAEFVRNW